MFLSFLFFKMSFIYLLLAAWVFVAEHGLSLVSASGSYSPIAVQGLLSAVTCLFVEYGL